MVTKREPFLGEMEATGVGAGRYLALILEMNIGNTTLDI